MPDDEKKTAEKSSEPPEGKAEAKEAPGAKGDVDKFRPEAIAERVSGLGQETEDDRVAREEEARLTERKKAKKGKSSLESAAAKRLARIGEAKVKRPSAGMSGPSMDSDPLLERTARLGEWLKEHQQVVGAALAIAILGGAGALGWSYWQSKRDADASALLAAGFADEQGTIVASGKDDDDDDTKPAGLYPTFKSPAERRDAALAQYRKVESKYAGTGAAMLARLAEAGLLLDAGDARGALGAYEDVKKSPLALADAQVRGRALEGIGFAYELLAQSDAAEKDRHLGDALSAFRQLEQVDLKGFKELGLYHQARVLQTKDDKTKAIELLKEVDKAVTEPGEAHPFEYLQTVTEDRLRDLDPTALPPKAGPGALGGAGAAGGKPNMSDPRVQEMLRQLEEQMKQKGGGANMPLPAPGGPR